MCEIARKWKVLISCFFFAGMEILYCKLQKWIPHQKLSEIDMQRHMFSFSRYNEEWLKVFSVF